MCEKAKTLQSLRRCALSLQSFSRKFEDNSTEGGFQFTFYCDISSDSYKTKFVPSQAGKKAGWSRVVGKGLSLGTSVLDRVPLGAEKTEKVGEKAEALTGEVSKQYGKMSPGWQKEHDEVFESAQSEARAHFNHCTVCKRWVCEYCWDAPKGLCVEDAKQVTMCPNCHQPAGIGKFCVNCGSPLSLKCPNCGAETTGGTLFCGQCGTKLT